jgi:hypothetical protein
MPIYKIFILTLSTFICSNLYSAIRQVRVFNKTQDSIGLPMGTLPPRSTRLMMLDTAQPLTWSINGRIPQQSSLDPLTTKITFERRTLWRSRFWQRPDNAHITCTSELAWRDWLSRRAQLFAHNYTAGIRYKAGFSFDTMPQLLPILALRDHEFAQDCYYAGNATTALLALYGFIVICPKVERWLNL